MEKLSEELRKLIEAHRILLIKKWEGIEKSAIYILSEKDLTSEEKKQIEEKLKSIYGDKYMVLFIDDLHPAQLKEVLEKFETIYVGDQELCDAMIAGILTLSHDFRFFVNEKMNMIIKRRLRELLPSY